MLHRFTNAAFVLAAGALGAVGVAPWAALADTDLTLNPAHVGATAGDFGDQDDDCGNAADEDGWHFVAPANTNFISLTVTFELLNGDPFTETLGPGEFGPPDDSHAFVITPAGATLTGGTATVDEDDVVQKFFVLSHTCPGTPGDGETTPGDGETTPGDGETTPGDGETTPGDGGVTLPKTGAGFPVEAATLVGLFLLAAGAALIKWRDELLLLYRRRH